MRGYESAALDACKEMRPAEPRMAELAVADKGIVF